MEQEKKASHDFNEPIEVTSTALAKIVLEKFNENKDLIIYEHGKERSAEDQKKSDEAYADMAISIVQLFATTDIPADYAAQPIDKLIALLNVTKNYITGTVQSIEDEYMSRGFGKKSPKTNTFARDVVTLGEMILKLEEMRQATGNNPDDYFIKKA